MPTFAKRLLDVRAFANMLDRQPLDEIVDAGAYNKLQLQVRVIKAGTAGNLLIRHSATRDEESFLTLSTTALNATSNTFVAVSDFLRFVRWETDGAVTGSPAATIDLVAKGT